MVLMLEDFGRGASKADEMELEAPPEETEGGEPAGDMEAKYDAILKEVKVDLGDDEKLKKRKMIKQKKILKKRKRK